MSQITNAGTYRGKVLEHGISETTNHFPQLVLKMSGLEYYDEATKEWCALDDTPDAMAYLVLVDGKGDKTLNCTQIEKVFGWDGTGLEGLENMPLEEKPIQFRAAFKEYNNQQKLGVEWVDTFDAEPGRIVKKLDVNEIKALQAKYGKAFAGKKTAVATVAKPPVIPAKTSTKAAGVTVPMRKPTAPKIEAPIGTCTQADAFAFVTNKELHKKDITDQVLTDIWLKVVTEVAGERPDSEITPAEWYTIREKVAKEIFVF